MPDNQLYIMTEKASVANHFIAELRDIEVQKDSFRFRQNLQRLGILLAYELSKTLQYEPSSVTTPLGKSYSEKIAEPMVMATILRAGLPLYNGFLQVFDRAESAFLGAWREEAGHTGQEGIKVNLEYLAAPPLDGKVLVLIDPMLATGKSLVQACEALLTKGTPRQIHLVSAIASKAGIQYVSQHLPQAYIWTGAVDPVLNDQAYIVPGLGDAGDLAFGVKS
jgi:uracil phosphoribosyltransferase